MFDFLKNFFRSGQGPSSEFDRILADSTRNLDIQFAITSHENWKTRLLAYLDGKSSEVFDPEVICFDNRCDLGKWIYGPGQAQLGQYPGFKALMDNHKLFHYAASNVVSLTKRGKTREARDILNGQFNSFSTQVVGALKALQQMRNRRKAK
jgi:hypothetical protein